MFSSVALARSAGLPYRLSICLKPGELRFSVSPVLESKPKLEPKSKGFTLQEKLWRSLVFADLWKFAALLRLRLVIFSPIASLIVGLVGGGSENPPPSCQSPKISRKRETFTAKAFQPGYGLLPEKWGEFSSHAKKKIRWAATAAELHFGKDNCIFLTGTLPGGTEKAYRALAEWSGYAMDRLQKWLRDNYAHEGALYHCGVWELQKRGALHYHALIAAPGLGSSGLLCERVGPSGSLQMDSEIGPFRKFWWGLLEDISRLSGIDLFERASGETWRDREDGIYQLRAWAQALEKSAASYLSKYLGKEKGQARSGAFPPSRWWACTRALSGLIGQYSAGEKLPKTTEELALDFFSLLEGWDFEEIGGKAFTWANPYRNNHLIMVARGPHDAIAKAYGYFCSICKAGLEEEEKRLIDEARKKLEEMVTAEREARREIEAWEDFHLGRLKKAEFGNVLNVKDIEKSSKKQTDPVPNSPPMAPVLISPVGAYKENSQALQVELAFERIY